MENPLPSGRGAFKTPDDAAVVVPLFDETPLRTCVQPELVEPFLDSVRQSAERGDFLFAFTMWISLGRVETV
ncbi:hypothetical protein [Streptomyces sp. CA-106131]|uniref:hypothetical protein n=1 Tax=Streptomyces sp. CA-106131 TaxID=3240045 RepID=UPI003D89DEDD